MPPKQLISTRHGNQDGRPARGVPLEAGTCAGGSSARGRLRFAIWFAPQGWRPLPYRDSEMDGAESRRTVRCADGLRRISELRAKRCTKRQTTGVGGEIPAPALDPIPHLAVAGSSQFDRGGKGGDHVVTTETAHLGVPLATIAVGRPACARVGAGTCGGGTSGRRAGGSLSGTSLTSSREFLRSSERFERPARRNPAIARVSITGFHAGTRYAGRWATTA